MHSSKLIQVLRTLSKEELRAFKDYLENTPIISAKSSELKYLLLFKNIYKYGPEFESTALVKEKIYKKIYPSQTYAAGKLEKLMSNLFSMFQDFIVFQYSDVDRELNRILVLSDFYRKNKLNNLAELNLKKYHNLVSKTIQKDTTFFYDSFLLEKHIVKYQTMFLSSNQKTSFDKVQSSLDIYYLIEKLEQACQMLAIHQNVIPLKVDENLIMLDHLKPLLDIGYYDVPIIKVYYKAYLFLSCENENIEQEFLDFEDEFNRYSKYLLPEQYAPLASIIRYYCIKQYRREKKGYLEKLFYLYKDHLEKGYLYFEKKISAISLSNIVEIGLNMNEHEWVLQFITAHKDKISDALIAAEVYHLNLAIYNFHLSKYNKALDCLEDNYQSFFYRIKARRLEIKIYHELDHVLLNPKIDAFKIFVYRISTNKLSKRRKDGNRDFVDMLKQINLPKTFRNDKRIKKLHDKIMSLKFIEEKDWLVKKLNELR